MKIIVCLAFLLCSAAGARAAEFDLGPHGILVVAVLEDWSMTGRPVLSFTGATIGDTFVMKPRNGAHAKCMLTFLYGTNGAPSQQAIRQGTQAITQEFVEGSVEKKQTLNEFSLEKGFGAYCAFTDASLTGVTAGPGDFKVIAVGEVQPDDNMLANVSLFANDAAGPDFKAMVRMINSLKVKSNLKAVARSIN